MIEPKKVRHELAAFSHQKPRPIQARWPNLKRAMYCDDCPWTGVNGELIAKDVLRCPKCNSERVKYLVSETASGVQ